MVTVQQARNDINYLKNIMLNDISKYIQTQLSGELKDRLWLLLPLLASMAVYANTLFYDFVWDDIYLISEDHAVKSFKYLRVIFSSDFFGHQEDELVYGYFRPLITLSYALDWSIWSGRPFGYHLSNILLHALSSVLTGVLLRKMKFSVKVSLAASLLFAVHPIHTENTAWISGRTDIWAFVFSISAAVVHLSEQTGTKQVLSKMSAALLFAAAMLSKEMSIVFIFWIAIIDRSFRSYSIKRVVVSLAPYVGVLLLYIFWRFYVVEVQTPFRSLDIGILEKLFSAPWTIVRYIAWLILPIKQSAYVQNPHISGLGDIRLYIGTGVLFVLSAILYKLRRKLPNIIAFATMFIVSFIPLLNFAAISAPADMGNVMAERFLYFPSFPFAALAVLCGYELTKQGLVSSRNAVSIFVVIIAVLGTATVLRNRVWKNNEVFYRETLNSTPSALIWCNLANHYIHLSEWKKAEQALVEAKKYFSDDYHYLSARALWHTAQGQYKDAIVLQEKIVSKSVRGRAVAYNNLAFLYRVTGNYKKAEALLLEIIENNKAHADVYFNLAEIYKATGRLKQAVLSYRESLNRRPDHLPTAAALAGALMENKKTEEAILILKSQAALYPDNAGLLNNLGIAYKKTNRLKEAVVMFEKAIKQDKSYNKARLNLAGVLILQQKNSEAIRHLEYIVKNARNTDEASAAKRILNDILN